MTNRDRIAMLDRVLPAIKAEAEAAGHTMKWFKPRAVHGFALVSGECRACDARTTVYRHADKISVVDLPWKCTSLRNKENV